MFGPPTENKDSLVYQTSLESPASISGSSSIGAREINMFDHDEALERAREGYFKRKIESMQ